MMELKQLHDFIVQTTEGDLVNYIGTNIKELKLLFLNLTPDKENTRLLSQVLVHLSSLQLSDQSKQTDEIQFLYTNLAFYFRSANKLSYVNNCIHHISESILKNRLNAWLHYKQYIYRDSHVKLFPVYLKKVSSAISDGEESYDNDVFRDIHEYFLYGSQILTKHEDKDLLHQFQSQFSDESLFLEYPILRLYDDNKYQFAIANSVNGVSDKIFEPTLFTEQLFHDKFLNYIRLHKSTKLA